jgi:mannose-1-phosphate guanylyltransferase
VVRFEEKPDENRAIDFLKSGSYYWNSGMFIWKARVIQGEFTKHMPALAAILQEIQHLVGIDHRSLLFSEKWQSIAPQTIDFGIMEKAKNVVVIPVEEIGWNDVGFWDSLFDLMPADENGNIILGSHINPLESKSIFVFSNEEKKMIIPLGVQNMIIVNTPDALLICPRGESQKVKMLVEYLKENHFTLFL